MQCCICSCEIEVTDYGWKSGHNALPVKDGRCCLKCNNEVVVPRRIAKMMAGELTKNNLEAYMAIAHDLKKCFTYDKYMGEWGWHDWDDEGNVHSGFPEFWDALCDAVDPYLSNEGQ